MVENPPLETISSERLIEILGVDIPIADITKIRSKTPVFGNPIIVQQGFILF
jgi:hypothetical protein